MSRKIDALIAEHVFGWEILQGNDDVTGIAPGYECSNTVPHYSTKIQYARLVVEHLSDDFEFRLWGPHRRLKDEDWDKFECELTNITTRAWYSQLHESASMAISLAILKALNVEIPE